MISNWTFYKFLAAKFGIETSNDSAIQSFELVEGVTQIFAKASVAFGCFRSYTQKRGRHVNQDPVQTCIC